MKKKYVDETYLREVTEYQVITRQLIDQNAYVVLKKIIKTNEPFVKKAVLIDNGYYILEYTPMDELYNARAFIDKDLNVISYYFDISLGNGIDDGRPYYNDLYLDIIYGIETDKKVKVLDEDELLEALEKGNITQQEYDLANCVCDKLVKEINKKNQNRNLSGCNG